MLLNSVRLFPLFSPSPQKSFSLLQQKILFTKILEKFVNLTQITYSNCSSTKALCKNTIYILLFIAQLSFPDGFEKTATIRAFLRHSFAYQLFTLQDLTKTLPDPPPGTLNVFTINSCLLPSLLETERTEGANNMLKFITWCIHLKLLKCLSTFAMRDIGQIGEKDRTNSLGNITLL